MVTEFEEAMRKIRQLNEEKTATTKELDESKDELAKIQVELLRVRKEALDASINAAEAAKKM